MSTLQVQPLAGDALLDEAAGAVRCRVGLEQNGDGVTLSVVGVMDDGAVPALLAQADQIACLQPHSVTVDLRRAVVPPGTADDTVDRLGQELRDAGVAFRRVDRRSVTLPWGPSAVARPQRGARPAAGVPAGAW